ncbi:MAG: SDR family oxidoreductase [Atopobiaceae bacterium]|nr:SDR family oxidoreductase [Atopobiaceae bacterium]
MGYVLVTGATGGIGCELCELCAADGHDLVLVARNELQLAELAERLRGVYGVQAEVLPADLAQDGAADALFTATKDAGIVIDVLVNCAGFGDQGAFLDSSWERQERMVRLNVVALMRLSYLFGNDMRSRGCGRILNVASVAAFSAGPYMSTYFASKAFVLSHSLALGEELRGSGVTVTALCPGVTGTGFWNVAHMEANGLFSLMGMRSPRSVAKLGYKAMMSGRPLALHSAGTHAANVAARLAPRRFSTWLMGRVLAKR